MACIGVAFGLGGVLQIRNVIGIYVNEGHLTV